MKKLTIDNPFDFPRALAESASETIIVTHDDQGFIFESQCYNEATPPGAETPRRGLTTRILPTKGHVMADSQPTAGAAAPQSSPAKRHNGHPQFGPDHHHWGGDLVTPDAGRSRALRMYPESVPCEECGAAKSERHHKDENPLNNRPDNIARLCRRCHTKRHDRSKFIAAARTNGKKGGAIKAAKHVDTKSRPGDKCHHCGNAIRIGNTKNSVNGRLIYLVCYKNRGGCGAKHGSYRSEERYRPLQYGENHPSSKLTNDEANQIKSLRRAGATVKELAIQFGVGTSTISRITNGYRGA